MPIALSDIETKSMDDRWKFRLTLSVDTQSSFQYAIVSEETYSLLYGNARPEGNEREDIISLKFIGSDVFKNPHIYPVSVGESVENGTVELHNLHLLQKYGLSFGVEFCEVKRIRKVLPLTRIYISFPEEVYNILRAISTNKLRQLLADEVDSNPSKVLIHTGDWFRQLHGDVFKTEPIKQGYMIMATEIVVVKRQHNMSSQTEAQCDSESLLELNSDILDFSISNESGHKYKFSVVSLRRDSLKKYVKHDEADQYSKEDDEYHACLKVSDMLKMNILYGDFVKVSTNGKKVCVRIFPFVDPSSVQSGTIHCSPLLLLNLGWPSIVSLEPMGSDHYLGSTLSDLFPIATSVTISRVAMPITLDRRVQSLALKSLMLHFKERRRVICKNQFVGVPIDTDFGRTMFEVNPEEDIPTELIVSTKPDVIIWYKITAAAIQTEKAISTDNISDYRMCTVVPDSTRLLQAGLLSETIPTSGWSNNSLDAYFNIPRVFTYPSDTTNGSGTFSYAEKLRKIVKTSFRIQDEISLGAMILLKSTVRCAGKSTLMKSVASEIGANLLILDGYDILTPGSPGKTIGTLRGKADRVVESCSKLIIFIKHIEALSRKTDPQQQQQQQQSRQANTLSLKLCETMVEYSNKGAIIVFSSNDPDSISEVVRSHVKFEIMVGVPNQLEREIMLKSMISSMNDDDNHYVMDNDVSIEGLSIKSAGLSIGDLSSVVEDAKNGSIDSAEKLAEENEISVEQLVQLNEGSFRVTLENFESAINKSRAKNSDAIGAPRIPDVKWGDIGGLENVKSEILDTIEMPLKHPELFGEGVKKRSGILFYGPPGTGKTLLAKAIATNFSLNFFSVKGPELLNMYIGESEANVRRVFQKARDSKPCVIFFDELDSVAPKRGNQGDSGGVMDRIVSQLLSELDGMSSSGGNGDGVFVVGATNRPDLLDEALLRPGRFDKMLYLGISDTHEKQAKIIEALTRKFKLSDDCKAPEIAAMCPYNYTGADFYALCSDAMLNAMIRTAGKVDKKVATFNIARNSKGEKPVNTRYWFDHVAKSSDTSVTVTLKDFEKARKEMVSSVSTEELNHYLKVRQEFEGSKSG